MPSKKAGHGSYAGGLGTDSSWGHTLFQPVFDPRMNLTFTGADRLEKGRIIPYKGPSEKNDTSYGVRFMYNPATLTVNYSADPSTYVMGEDAVAGQEGNAVGGSYGSLAFNLAFDRTYETWDQSKHSNVMEPGYQTQKFGCYVDIRQFYLMLGIIEPYTNQVEVHGSHGTSQGSGGVGIPENAFKSFNEEFGPMKMTPCMVYFGGAKSMRYFGVFTSMGVTYSHFTSQMTPVRAIVNLSMELRTKPKKKGGGGGGGGGGGSSSSSSSSGSSARQVDNKDYDGNTATGAVDTSGNNGAAGETS
jgi:hypothetical protein